MLSLRPLPTETVSRIVSGQIITSAYSVVKELVENALDAEAKSIEIRLDNFGLDKVEVKDDGCGLSRAEIQLMTKKDHYTSKINQFQDLTNGNLTTYGFRGEAVNAICTVAEVKIISKRAEDVAAIIMKCDNKGEPQNIASVAGNNGTTVTATDLFKKLPVRRNYILKGNRKNEDLKKIEHLVRSYGIVVWDLRISLFHNNKMIFIKPAAQTMIDSIRKTVDIPAECFEHMKSSIGNAVIDLWIPKAIEPINDTPLPSDDNGNYKVYLFMNRRPVSDKKIEKSVKKYLLLAASQNPGVKQLCSIICIETAKDEIDVNLDPNKNTVFLVHNVDILTSVEEKLAQYYNCSTEDIEKKRVEKSRNFVQPKDEIVFLGDHPIINERANKKEVDIVSPFGDNSFGTSLDNDFDKLFKSKQQLTLHNVSSSEQNDGDKNPPPYSPIQNKSFPTYHLEDENSVNNSRGSSIEEVNVGVEHSNKNIANSAEKSWSRGNILKTDDRIISPVAHYKQPKISVFSDKKEDWKSDSDSFVQQEKRAKLQSDTEENPFYCEKPRTIDKAKKRDGAGNQTMENLARGPNKTPEKRSQNSKMFRNVTPVQFDMSSVTRHIQRKVEDSERKKSEPERSRKPKTDQGDNQTKVLGQLNPSGYWVCMIKNGVHIVNHHKLQEVVLYKRLLQSNALPISQFAGHPLEVFEGEQAWDKRLTSTLVDMAPQHKPGSSQRFRKITDQRFTFNGFDIRVENETDRALLFGVCSSVISFMGVTDVHEILKEIVKNPEVSIEDCRPQKIKKYLESEAVRLERQTPPSVDRGQMDRLLNVMTRHDLDVCLHSKPLKSNNLLKRK